MKYSIKPGLMNENAVIEIEKKKLVRHYHQISEKVTSVWQPIRAYGHGILVRGQTSSM